MFGKVIQMSQQFKGYRNTKIGCLKNQNNSDRPWTGPYIETIASVIKNVTEEHLTSISRRSKMLG